MRQYLQQIPHVMRTCKQHGSSFNGLLLTRGAFKVGMAAAFGVATEAPIHLAASECGSDVSAIARVRPAGCSGIAGIWNFAVGQMT